jgi:hypothetical protein
LKSAIKGLASIGYVEALLVSQKAAIPIKQGFLYLSLSICIPKRLRTSRGIDVRGGKQQ